jgi:predicted transcriptional regulator
MERKRNRVEIMHDMLKIIQENGGNVKKTHLMYKANLSHKQMESYLKDLVENGLIDMTISSPGDKTLIKVKQKGSDFLIKYIQVREFEKTFGL